MYGLVEDRSRGTVGSWTADGGQVLLADSSTWVVRQRRKDGIVFELDGN